MGKTVVVAEKSSVAGDIAAALGVPKTGKGWWEGGDIIVTNARGHLVEIDVEKAFAVERPGLDGLPIALSSFPLRLAEGVKPLFSMVASLMKRPDVETLVNACDAGREGELIFRYIVAAAGVRKPEYRLWLQSMTPASIVAGFSSLRPAAEMVPLANAALCRSEADVLVGINGSRMLAAVRGSSSPVGRVMTPTLMLMVARERAIKAFVARKFWDVVGKFQVAAGEFSARWVASDASLRNGPVVESAEGDAATGQGTMAGRFFEVAAAQALVAKCRGQVPTWMRDETKPLVKQPPLLFDLTALQQEANRRYGFAAKDTLAAAQSLYETHKSLTYPRTDARALPEDYPATVVETLSALAMMPEVTAAANHILQNGWVDGGNRRIFNNKKISDHFAIIPSGKAPGPMSDKEAKVYGLVLRRFLAAFFPAAEFMVTKRAVDVVGELFVANGQVMIKQGWLAVEQESVGDESKVEAAVSKLPALLPGEKGALVDVTVKEGVTKPPARFTEATLLAAMATAGKDLADELKDAMREKGMGTPATRAATIEKLKHDKMVVCEGRTLVPTGDAFEIIGMLEELGALELTSPEMTGEWESKLAKMAEGGYSRQAFMGEIAAMCGSLVEKGRKKGAAKVPMCADCGKPMVKRVGKKGAFWGCSGYPGCKGVVNEGGGGGDGAGGGEGGGIAVQSKGKAEWQEVAS